MKYVDNVCSKIVTPLKSSVKGFLFEVGLILNTSYSDAKFYQNVGIEIKLLRI